MDHGELFAMKPSHLEFIGASLAAAADDYWLLPAPSVPWLNSESPIFRTRAEGYQRGECHVAQLGLSIFETTFCSSQLDPSVAARIPL